LASWREIFIPILAGAKQPGVMTGALVDYDRPVAGAYPE
jgi:hypothetical protein